MTEITIIVKPSYLKRKHIHIPAEYGHLLPGSVTKVQLEANFENGKTLDETQFYPPGIEHGGPGIRSFGLTQWFKSHPKLEVGDKLRLTVINEKKFRLDILK